LKAVQEMKKIIRDNNLTVMATIARYANAYESILKPDWWNKELRSVRIDVNPYLELTSLIVVVLSSNRGRISAISRVTLEATLMSKVYKRMP
jgi:hypothetical protein